MTAATILPRYPVYVPTRGRWQEGRGRTIRFLMRDDVPFRAVVVPAERDQYATVVGEDRLLVLPSDDYVLKDARNFIRDHAVDAGYTRHWQLDDNIYGIRRFDGVRRVPCETGVGLRVCEDFTDRYRNVALSGLNYDTFVRPLDTKKPFYLNCHVYSCTLINHAAPIRWRLVYNDDTDICLQALAAGWTTLLLNAFMAKKVETMTTRGGNTDDLYGGDGRLVMARALERAWPGVVKTTRRFGRPQHYVDWTKFKTPLDPKPKDEWPPPLPPMTLREVRDVKSESLRRYADEARAR
jgi:hypothetical protein